MVLFRELLYFFPPVYLSTRDVYIETNNQYSIYKAFLPLKEPPPSQYYSYQILEELQMVRQDLNSVQNEQELKFKLQTLYKNWGINGKNILNQSATKLIFEIITKIDQKNIMYNEMIEYSNELMKNYKSLPATKKQEVKNYKKYIDDLIEQMNENPLLKEQDVENNNDKILIDIFNKIKINKS